MLNGSFTSLDTKLKQAEEAEAELERLGPLASEAPRLREEKAKSELAEERRHKREAAMEAAKKASKSAADAQKQVPEFLGIAAMAVKELYNVLREIDSHRQEASQALAIADRVDYDVEVETGEEHEIAQDRDPRGLAYALAAKHGDVKIRQMLEDLDPEFNFLRNCYLDEKLQRDLADFVIRHAVNKPQASEAQVVVPAQEAEVAQEPGSPVPANAEGD
jgi:NADH dehydrogenase/NADH:ubiquinone oxidoreductase subunit G